MRVEIVVDYEDKELIAVRVNGEDLAMTRTSSEIEEHRDGFVSYGGHINVLDPPDHTPKVHANPKRAEWDAARGIAPNVNTSGWKVLRAFAHSYERGEEGLTSHQIATRLTMNPYTAKPRCTELAAAGFIYDTGLKGPGPSGDEVATVFKITHIAALSMELREPPQGHVVPLPLEENP